MRKNQKFRSDLDCTLKMRYKPLENFLKKIEFSWSETQKTVNGNTPNEFDSQ